MLQRNRFRVLGLAALLCLIPSRPDGQPVIFAYATPFAFNSGIDGVEVVVKHAPGRFRPTSARPIPAEGPIANRTRWSTGGGLGPFSAMTASSPHRRA